MMGYIRKFVAIAGFAAGLLGLSVTAAYAGSSTECLPGCYCPKANAAQTPTTYVPSPRTPGDSTNPNTGAINGARNHGGVLGVLEDHSNAIRVRDKGYARQIGFQNDNAIGVTCFDHALALTSRLGAIFSDVAPPGGYNGANSTVFKSAIFSPSAGTDKFLLDAINAVVIPQYNNHVNDFKDSLSDNLGATLASAFMTLIMGFFNGLLAPITAAVSTMNGIMSTFNSLVSTLKTAMRALQFVVGIPAFYIFLQTLLAAINAAFAAVKALINGALKAIQTTIKTLVNALLAWLMGGATSMAAASGTKQGECDRVQELWGNGLPATFQTNGVAANFERALTGTGRQGGTPYMSFSELLSGAPPAALSGQQLLAEFANPLDSQMLNDTLADVGAGGALNQPGNLLSWPISPQVATPFARGTLPAAVISKMR